MLDKMSFFKIANDMIFVDTEQVRVYIPKDYFIDNGIAELFEDTVQTMCVFYFTIHSKDDDPIVINKSNLYFLKLPFTSQIQYDNIEHNVSVEIEGIEDKYTVLYCNKGSVFIPNINFIKSGGNVMKFFNILNTAKLKKLKYSDIFDLFIKTLEVNGVNLQVTFTIIEGIVAELCRQSGNISEPFRKLMGGDKPVNENDFKMISSKLLAHINSTMASIDYEDLTKALIISTERTLSKKKDRESPLEKVLYY